MTKRLLAVSTLAVAMAGCAMTPKPMSPQDIAKRVEDDRAKMYADQDPVTGPLSLAEVSARAMKYNLDYRLKVMEEALAQGTLDVTRWDMFPRLLLNAGYVHRSNDLAYVTSSGQTSTTTLERNRRIASAEFSWNILDFGVSYFRAKMASDQVLVAEERKRKVMQNLMQDVRIAYWRALGAQRLMAQMDALTAKSKTALSRARQIEQQGLLPQAQALAYQRALLDSTVLLQARRQDLELAKMELAGLMNLPPNTQFTLLDNNEPLLPPAPANLEKLEEIALVQRPELREEDYRKRISVADANRALVATLPGLSLDLSSQYDSNRYLLNNSWMEGGLRLSMSLFRLASIPSLNRQRDAQLSVDDTRRMAQAMAVLTQVRVAAQRYSLAKDELDQVSESASVDQRLANYSKAAATSRVDSELEVIRTEARALLSSYQRHVAYANAQAAFGRLFNSVGLDVLPPEGGYDLPALTETIDKSLQEWQRATFERVSATQLPAPKVAVVVENGTDPRYAAAIKEGVGQALNRYNIEVADAPDAWKMVVRLMVANPSGTTRRADWVMTMYRPNGVRAGAMSYSSVMPQDFTTGAINALTQSAIDSYSVAMNDWLVDKSRQPIAARLVDSPEATQN
ncbi:MAG: TolC family protein [Burkholderiaceae bacterium]